MTTAQKKRFIIWLRAAIGIVLIALVITNVNLSEMLNILSGTQINFLMIMLFLYFSLFVIKTLRWKLFLYTNSLDMPFLKALHTYIFSCVAGFITPARVGELIRIVPPAEKNGRYADSAACAIVDKVFDIALLAGLLCVGSMAPLLASSEKVIIGGMGLLIILFLTAGIFWLRKWLRSDNPIPERLLKLFPKAWHKFTLEKPIDFFQTCYNTYIQSWLLGTGLTVLFWIFHVACHYMMLSSLGLEKNMHLGYFIMCLILVTLIEFLPISISGFGAREVFLVYLFDRVGLSKEETMAFASLNLFLMYVVTSLFALSLWPIAKISGNYCHDK